MCLEVALFLRLLMIPYDDFFFFRTVVPIRRTTFASRFRRYKNGNVMKAAYSPSEAIGDDVCVEKLP